MRTQAELLVGSLARGDGVLLEWRLGFLRGARIQHGFAHRRRWESAVMMLHWFLRLPAARFLTDLCVARSDRGDYGEEIECLAQSRLPRTLRRLSLALSQLHENALVQTDFGSTLGDVSPIYAAFPELRELTVEAREVRLGAIELPELRRFELRVNSLGTPEVTALLRARWPRLSTLVVWVRAPAQEQPTLLDPLLAHLEDNLPSLRHLGLFCTTDTGRLCEVLSRGKLLPRLERRDLWMGSLDDTSAQTLARMAGAFAHLEVLNLSNNRLTNTGFESLAPLAHNLQLGGQRP